MKTFFTTLILLCINVQCLAQKNIATLNECQFFDTLHSLSINNYNNPEYDNLKNNWAERRALLLRLEDYLVYFESFEIAPIYLEVSLDDDKSKTCDSLTSKFKELVTENNLKSRNLKLKKDEIKRIIQKKYKESMTNIKLLLLDFCGLLEKDSSNLVERNIAEFKNSLTLELLYEAYNNDYIIPCQEDKFDEQDNCLSRMNYENNLDLISKRISYLDNNNYAYYESSHGQSNILKGFEAHHRNDRFILPPRINQDRELTGSFKFLFITDWFKWRFLNIFENSPTKVISYQTISFGGDGYTPYIRYRNNFELADSIHNYDRPFGSYYFLERAKYRTWRHGLFRQRGEFQVGSIGLSAGRKIQAKLHEDVTVGSQFVYGWDKQIGDGGRLVFQFNQKLDLLLFSTNNRYRTIFSPKMKNDIKNTKKYWGHNLILELDGRFGGYLTAVSLGLRYSTLNFLKQSGTNKIVSRTTKKNGKREENEYGWKFDCGINYRYIIHNTMLEGLGYLNTFPQDQYDIVNPDYYVLSNDQIQRNIISIDFGLNFRWRKTTFYYKHVYHTLEYRPSLATFDFQDSEILSTINSDDIEFYHNKVVKEQKDFLSNTWFNGKVYYGYGVLGLSWIIE